MNWRKNSCYSPQLKVCVQDQNLAKWWCLSGANYLSLYQKELVISLEESWSDLLMQTLLQGAVGDIFGVPGFLVASFRSQDARADPETIDLDFGKIHSAYIDILKVDKAQSSPDTLSFSGTLRQCTNWHLCAFSKSLRDWTYNWGGPHFRVRVDVCHMWIRRPWDSTPGCQRRIVNRWEIRWRLSGF